MVRPVWFAVILATGTLGASGAAPVRSAQVTYWDNGQMRERTPLVDGRVDGLVQAWDADGRPMWVRAYRAGREDGVHEGWWPDGTPKFSLRYVAGLLEGDAHEWYPDGTRYRDSHYHAGQEAGLQRMYDAGGVVRASYEVRNGRRYGSIGAMGCTPKRVVK